MAKVFTRDIAKALSEKKGIGLEEAERYIESFFSLIDEGLIAEKNVKIKGFGTFKLIEVKDRESVDINTGERMVIDSHSKISFTPDATLKDLVNKPFSQFETVALNDSDEIEKDFAALEEREYILSETAEADSSEVFDAKTEEMQAIEEKQNDNVDENRENVLEDDNNNNIGDANGKLTETESEERDINVPLDNVRQEEDEEIKIDTSINDDDEIAESSHDNFTEDSLPVDEIGSELVDDVQDNESAGNKDIRKHSFLRITLSLLVAVALMSVVFFLGYSLGDRRGNITTKVAGNVVQVRKPAIKKPRKVKITDSLSDAVKKDSICGKQKKDSVLISHRRENSEKAITPLRENADSPTLSNARKMVKTGAYIIIGTEKSVKVKPGQTLKSISRLYLGEGMECYIQIHNGKSEVSEGETINIPKLKLKKKVTNKKVS